MTRNNIAFLASTFLLSAAMVIRVDLFTFSKVVFLPAWTKDLPIPIMFPAYFALFCLIPATFIANTLASARVAIAKSVLLSPLAAIAIYALNPSHQNRFLFANALFNYVWIVLFHCLLPALLLVGARTCSNTNMTSPEFTDFARFQVSRERNGARLCILGYGQTQIAICKA